MGFTVVASYRDLLVWQRGMDLVGEVYRATATFPADERFGLSLQLRRAAVSVPSNLAEGQGRGRGSDFARFVRIAKGSVQEVETQLLIAVRLGYLTDETTTPILATLEELSRMLSGLLRSLAVKG